MFDSSGTNLTTRYASQNTMGPNFPKVIWDIFLISKLILKVQEKSSWRTKIQVEVPSRIFYHSYKIWFFPKIFIKFASKNDFLNVVVNKIWKNELKKTLKVGIWY